MVAGVSVVLMGAILWPSPAGATGEPQTTISAPAAGSAYLPGSAVVFRGGATDDVGVSQVRLSLQDTTTTLWFRSDGTWGARQWRSASLESPGAPSTSWAWTWQASLEGRFVLHAQAKDAIQYDSSEATLRVVVSAAAETRFLTLAFGRTQWVTAHSCRPLAGAVTLGHVADELAARDLVGTGNVVIDRESATSSPRCFSYGLGTTWEQLASLRDTFGWNFISAGQSYRDMTTLTTQQQIDESCGSLAALQAHGHDRGWGLFAYPNNRRTSTIQKNVVSTCFSYGRVYDFRFNRIGSMGPPWFQRTTSVNGGSCNVVGAWCYDPASVGANHHYRTPASLAALMQPGPGRWSVVQMYRFVDGAQDTSIFDWDCTDPDPAMHWTSSSEIYCLNDYLWALDQIPTDVLVTDPATVAEAWGRGNPNP